MRAVPLLLALALAGCLASPQDPPSPLPVTQSTSPHADVAASAPPPGVLRLPATIHAATVGNGAEPNILADRNGKFVWIGNDNQQGGSGGYRSSDNGTSWSATPNDPTNIQCQCLTITDGWSIAQDEAGHMYMGVLSYNRVDVLRSSDGGASWDQTGAAAGVSGTADRPWLAAKGDGHVALFYFDAPAVATGFFEHCAQSDDGGMTFTDRDPVSLPPTGGSAFYDSQGRLYFSDNNGNLYRFDGTCLGGSTSIPMASNLGVNNMVQSAADGTDLYTAAATANGAITLFGSHDGHGVTKLVVSPDSLKSNTYATVAAHDGQVAVAWYGSTTAGDPSSTSFSGDFNVYLSVVDNFWSPAPHITRYQLSDKPNHKGTICMGGVTCPNSIRGLQDYFGIAYDIWGGLHVAYVDDTSGSAVTDYVHVPPKAAPPPATPQAPHADFTVHVKDKVASVDATASASPSGSALTYSWTWGDGASATGRTADHTYRAYGNFTITLTVTDAAGLSGTHATRIAVDGTSQGPPVASWSVDPAQPVAGEDATFEDASHAAAGATLSAWSWQFGDGASGSGAKAHHTYAEAGNYTVRLTVTDNRGAQDQAENVVVVLPAGTPTDSTTTEPPPSSGPTSRSPGLTVPLLLGAVTLALAIARRRA